MIKVFRYWFEQRIIKRSEVTDIQWKEAFELLPLLDGLSDSEKRQLKRLAILFLHYKVFESAHGLIINISMKLVISLQACLPILKLGVSSYSDWISIIVYPSAFATEQSITDENGVVHYIKSSLAGEAWQRGPVILAWDEAKHAGIIDGSNLVIHEFAHKLDMQNGVANGFPPLHANMNTGKWIKEFTKAFEHFEEQCRRRHSMGIDCYAATSPAEFFAVLTEVFFECPYTIKKHYSAVYDLLCMYYKQEPLKRLSQI